MATHSSILAWRIPWREEPVCIRRIAKSQTQLSMHAHKQQLQWAFKNMSDCIFPLLKIYKCLLISLWQKFSFNCGLQGFMVGPWLPWWLRGKESTCDAGDAGGVDSIPGSGRSLGAGNCDLFQYSCLENSMDRRAWRATAQRGCKESSTAEQLSTHPPTCQAPS